MVYIIFVLKTSHPMDYHKICFTNFDAQKLKIWFLQDCKKSGFWIKGRREPLSHWQRDPHVRPFFLTTETTFTGDFSATARSSAKPRAPTWSPDSCELVDPLFPTVEPPEGAWRRSWRLGGGARRYDGALRPVERDLEFPTAPVNYGEAF